jgi:hypothetical protein
MNKKENSKTIEKPKKVNDKQKILSEKQTLELNINNKSLSPVSVKETAVKDKTNLEEKPVEQEEKEKNYNDYTREQLIDFLKDVIKVKDITTIKNEVSLIKIAFYKKNKKENDEKLKQFIAEGGLKEDYQPSIDSVEENFNKIFKIYKERRKEFLKEQEKQKQKNLSAKEQVLEDLKKLIDSEETLKKTYDDFKAIQTKWKDIGQIPSKNLNDLWQSYNFLVERFLNKVKINKELKDLDLKKNLEKKIELCEKAEELLLETSIQRAFKKLQEYHREWKELGPAPSDKKDEIWERFKSATDNINEKRYEFYVKQQQEQQQNFITKTALCEKIEEISYSLIDSYKRWKQATDNIIEIQKTWKTIGFAPKKQNNEVWNRFRNAVDSFFAKKKEYFDKLKEKQTDNYNRKLNICVQAEAVKSNTEWKKTTKDLINLQKEWKTIGPVPRKYSDEIWNRFRSSCDEFFNNKSSYFENIKSEEEQNLKHKLELIEQINKYKFGKDDSKNLEILKDFQRKWTETGNIPVMQKTEIQKKYRVAIEKGMDKLKLPTTEKILLNYKTNLESVKESSGANEFFIKSKNGITNKIKIIKNDINLWENNIGFFAKSKNADILKNEFVEKINKAKQEISILEEKLKLISKYKK